MLLSARSLGWQQLCVRAYSHTTIWWPHGLQPTRLLCPWTFPGKNTGVGYHFLLQGIFPTEGLNLHLCLLHLLCWQADSLPLCHLRSPPDSSYILANISRRDRAEDVMASSKCFYPVCHVGCFKFWMSMQLSSMFKQLVIHLHYSQRLFLMEG